MQGDLCLDTTADDTKESYVMAAAAVIFCFDHLTEKL
jgi:hypothetical protein